MARRSTAGAPQSLDDNFVADMIRDLKVVGNLGILNVADGIIPVYLLGQRTAFQVEVQSRFYAPTEVFSIGEVITPAPGTVLADTDELQGGIYDLQITIGSSVSTSESMATVVEHRDRTNTVNINAWSLPILGFGFSAFDTSLVIDVDERLRVITAGTIGSGSGQAAIMAKRRSV